jgi:hypothetical protein
VNDVGSRTWCLKHIGQSQTQTQKKMASRLLCMLASNSSSFVLSSHWVSWVKWVSDYKGHGWDCLAAKCAPTTVTVRLSIKWAWTLSLADLYPGRLSNLVL